MHPMPHTGSEPVGPAREVPVQAGAEIDDPPRPLPQLSQAADRTLAATAFATNQAFSTQIALVHILAGATRETARAWSMAAQEMPQGTGGIALAALARTQIGLVDALVRAVNAFGRRFGRLAFAFPPVACGWTRPVPTA